MAMKLDQIVNQVEEVCDCFLLLQKSLVKRPSSDLHLLGGATILAIYSTLHFGNWPCDRPIFKMQRTFLVDRLILWLGYFFVVLRTRQRFLNLFWFLSISWSAIKLICIWKMGLLPWVLNAGSCRAIFWWWFVNLKGQTTILTRF